MKMIFGFVAILAAGAATAVAQSVDEEIAQRIAPVGSTCMQGDECAAAAAAPAAAGGGARSGEDIFNASCNTCHGAGIAGAPKFGDAGAWAPRIAQGMDTLYTHALNGFNAMPAKGLCMDCSEDEVKAAVDYMVENSK
ncbi:c-type cytochrome [Microbulbifer thermotolerans]|uniref:Cytochrome C n=1 Tax=Microbulbifer thermotolerans TaxID=252514 RepID=A0A143HIH5_MICTH|nr:cytochrome c5 family protein [Microbulbifer thermotolerans]AMX01306.1 cytochrome C [Microbulbifer thermotolerans]MCX2779108.1 cytochrome c5 family protein [Microbulbifer thermotolerans]MCX2782706.1 cytochrome c5 family protein [Microbulbifer thermotolerans]MCX2795640.1 cytochrome c5 family protein [Microbulbifer thermotolerans]MCX2800174.1 cytochrome c5 family protein [Microbulbifer thermotolerans]